MRRLHIAAKHVSGVHCATGHHLPIRDSGSHSYGAVMTAEALVAHAAKQRLCRLVLLRITGVRTVALGRELLVPQSQVQARVWRVAVGAGVRSGARNWR